MAGGLGRKDSHRPRVKGMLGISGLTKIPQMPKRTAYLPETPYDPMPACRMSHHSLYCQTYMYCDYLPCREPQEIDH